MSVWFLWGIVGDGARGREEMNGMCGREVRGSVSPC